MLIDWIQPAAKAATVPPVAPVADLCETEMRESLLKKQKELLELQQKKLEIELLQTKARLQQQQVHYQFQKWKKIFKTFWTKWNIKKNIFDDFST